MEFRIIRVDYKSKYDDRFRRKRALEPGTLRYYIVQYRKEPSLFGLIRHDWKSVEYNAEEYACDGMCDEIRLRPVSFLFDGRDVLVPTMQDAKLLLALAKKDFGIDPVASEFEVVYQEKEMSKRDNRELAGKYEELING